MSNKLTFDEDPIPRRRLTPHTKTNTLVRWGLAKNASQANIIMITTFIVCTAMSFLVVRAQLTEAIPEDVSPRNTPSGRES